MRKVEGDCVFRGKSHLNRFAWLAGSVLLLVAMLTTGMRAQEYRGSLAGTVTDPTGAAIPGAKIEVRNNATNAVLTVGTSDQGLYTVLDLDPGFYTVTVTANGFKTLVRNNIEVRTGVRLGLDLPLEVGSISQQVTVSAESPLLITDSGSGGTVLNSEIVGSLPLVGSNAYFSLIQLTNGNSSFGGAPDHLSARPFDNGGEDGFSVNGSVMGGNNNSYLLDGAPNNNNEGMGFVPPPDAISEVNVMTNEYDAEFGKTGGGITSIALKTGTNDYHGAAYWNVRNNHLNAVLSQNVGQRPQVTQWSEPGFQIGGPVRIPKLYNGRDKTFFSVSYEHFYDKNPSSVTRVYPSQSQLAGNFCSGAPGNAGIGVLIYDPTTGSTTSPTRSLIGGGSGAGGNDNCPAGQTGSIIPAGRIDPIMSSILSSIPTANVYNPTTGVLCTDPRTSGCGTGNYTIANGHGDWYHAATVRIDQNLSSTEKFFSSYEVGNRLEYIDNPGSPAGLFPLENTWRINHGATANLTSVLSPTLTSTFKVNWLRHNGLGISHPEGTPATSLGFSSSLTSLFGADNFPGVGFNTNAAQAVTIPGSVVAYTGFTQGGSNSTSLVDNWTVQEGLNKVYGAHSLKWGGLITITTENQESASLVPTINFSDVFTRPSPTASGVNGTTSTPGSGDAIATALLGYPTSFSYTNPFRGSYETRYFDLFVQDDYRVTRRLTVNVGLRWDSQTPPHERYDRAVIGFNPAAVSVGALANPLASTYCSGVATNPLLCPTNGLGGTYLGGLVYATPDQRSPFASDFRNWGPRFGFAYQAARKLVFRGGWGRFYDYAGAYNFPGSTGYTSTSTASPTPNSFQNPTLCGTGFSCPAGNPVGGLSANGYAALLPSGLVPITGNTLGAKTGAGGAISFIDPNFRPLWVNQFNFGLDYQLPWQMVFHIEYNGSRSHNVPLSSTRSLDAITESQFLTLGPTGALSAQVTNPFQNLLPGTSVNLPTQTTEQQLLLPFPQYTGVTEADISIGRLWYNALQAKIEKRLTHGLTAQWNITFDSDVAQTALLNPSYDSLSLTDVTPKSPFAVCTQCGVVREPFSTAEPYTMHFLMTYKLPFFNGTEHRFIRGAFGGWTIAGSAQFNSGYPIASPSMTNGNIFWTGVSPVKSIPGVWSGKTKARMFNNCVENSSGTGIIASSISAGCPSGTPAADAPWQETSAVGSGLPNAVGTFYLNNIPPYFNSMRTLRSPEATFALFKSFAITETKRFEIRADAYNLTNTPAFGYGDNGATINTTATSSSFGQTNADQGNDPRLIQLTGRFTF